MSNTNQVCITCTQRDNCQYYDSNRTICVPVKTSDYGQFVGSLQSTIDWRHYRIQASIAAMQGMLSSKETMESIAKQARKLNISIPAALAELSVGDADALIKELKKGEEQ